MKRILSIWLILIILAGIMPAYAAENFGEITISCGYSTDAAKVEVNISDRYYEPDQLFMMKGMDKDGNINILYTNTMTSNKIAFAAEKKKIAEYVSMSAQLSYKDGTVSMDIPIPSRIRYFTDREANVVINYANGSRETLLGNGEILLSVGETVYLDVDTELVRSIELDGKECIGNRIPLNGKTQIQTLEMKSFNRNSQRNIFKLSENIKPGDCFNIYGSELLNSDTVYAKNLNTGDVFELPVINKNEYYVVSRIKDKLSAGQYEIYVKAGDSKTNTMILNAPAPKWIDNTNPQRNQTVNIYGSCLDPKEYGSDRKPEVRLSDKNGNMYYMTVTEINPYRISFNVGNTAPAGKYTVQVSCGYDKWYEPEYTEYDNTVEISEQTTDTFDLGTGMANQFIFNNTTELSAVHGSDITALLQKAVDKASENGGGTVKIPEGEFITGRIMLQSNVVIMGSGSEKTKLLVNIKDEFPAMQAKTKENIGISNLSVELLNGEECEYYPDMLFSVTGNNIFMTNVNMNLPQTPRREQKNPRLIPIAVFGDNVIIRDCSFASYTVGPYIVGNNAVIENNVCSGTDGKIYSVGNRHIITGNSIDINKIPVPSGQSEGIITRGPSYVAENTVSNAGKLNLNDRHLNDGETILTENAGGGSTSVGSIKEGYSYGAVLDADYINKAAVESWCDLHIVIVSGKGMGQYRTIKEYYPEQGKVILNKPWDIIPDTSSNYIIIMPIKGAVFYKNTAMDSAKGFWFYRDNIDCVMAENISQNTSGYYIASSNQLNREHTEGDFSIAYYNSLIKNYAGGASWRSHNSIIGTDAIDWVDTDDTFGILNYGTEIRDNIYDGPGEGNKNHAQKGYGNDEPSVNGICIGHARRSESDVTVPMVSSAIVSGNSINDSDEGYSIGGNLYPNAWYYNKTSNIVDGTTNIIMYNNSVQNTDKKYIINHNGGYAGLDIVGRAEENAVINPLPFMFKNDSVISEIPEDGKFTIKMSVKNIDMAEGSVINGICAVYSDGKLVKVFESDTAEDLNKKITDLSSDIDLSDIDTDDCTIKYFLWNTQNLKPVSSEVFIIK